MSTESEVAYLIEIRGLFDGWSIAVLEDGTWKNRWNPEDYPYRHAATQEYIEKHGPGSTE